MSKEQNQQPKADAKQTGTPQVKQDSSKSAGEKATAQPVDPKIGAILRMVRNVGK